MSELGLTAVPVIALVLTFGVLVILLLIIWSIKRHRDPDLHIECDSPIEDLIPSLAGRLHFCLLISTTFATR